jgi:hypothetical protein
VITVEVVVAVIRLDEVDVQVEDEVVVELEEDPVVAPIIILEAAAVVDKLPKLLLKWMAYYHPTCRMEL